MSVAPREKEREEGLWAVVAPPAVWALHFLASYITAAIWCAKIAGASGSLAGARIAIFAYTGIALVVLAVLGVRGYRRHSEGGGQLPHAADTAESRRRFLGFAAFLLSLLSVVAVLYAATAALVVGDCR